MSLYSDIHKDIARSVLDSEITSTLSPEVAGHVPVHQKSPAWPHVSSSCIQARIATASFLEATTLADATVAVFDAECRVTADCA